MIRLVQDFFRGFIVNPDLEQEALEVTRESKVALVQAKQTLQSVERAANKIGGAKNLIVPGIIGLGLTFFTLGALAHANSQEGENQNPTRRKVS